jgi:hypothetical protein
MRIIVTIFFAVLAVSLITSSGVAGGLQAKNHLIANMPLPDYLEKRGFHVLSDEGQRSRKVSYKLTKELLVSQYGIMVWGVQSFDPTPYIGCEFYYRRFLVNNHPLDKRSTEGKTVVDVIIVGGIPIGGIAMPYSREVLLGSRPYALDGRTLSKVHGISNDTEYDAWMLKWREQFK